MTQEHNLILSGLELWVLEQVLLKDGDHWMALRSINEDEIEPLMSLKTKVDTLGGLAYRAGQVPG